MSWSVRADLREEVRTSSLVERPVPLLTVDLERCEGLGGMQVVVDGQRRSRVGKSLRIELRVDVGRAVPVAVVSCERDEARKVLSIQLWQGRAAVRGFAGYRDALGSLNIPDAASFRSRIRGGERRASY